MKLLLLAEVKIIVFIFGTATKELSSRSKIYSLFFLYFFKFTMLILTSNSETKRT